MLYSILFYFSNGGFILSNNSYFLYFIFSQNFITPHPDFFILAWSISIEEWFYLLLPLSFSIVNFFMKISAKTLLSAIFVLLTGITLFRVFVVYYYDPEWDAGVRRITSLRLDALLMGVLAAYIRIYFENSWNKYSKYCFVIGIMIILSSSFWLYLKVIVTYMSADFFSKTFLFSFFSCGIALCLPYLSEIKTAKNRFIGKLITHISIVSYSLYLFHVLISYLVITILNKLLIQDITLLKFTLVWVFSMLAATVLYKCYERPFMNLRERFKL